MWSLNVFINDFTLGLPCWRVTKHFFQVIRVRPVHSGVTRGARGDICPRAQHFRGSKLRSECYVLITKCQMSADANNYNLQNVGCHCEISSRSPRLAERATLNLSDVSTWRFCLQQ